MTLTLSAFAMLLPFSLNAAPGIDEEALCLRNESERTHLFVVEAPGAGRLVQEIAPGESLCAAGAIPGATGVVSVFEGINALEGCSRLVPVGQSETMIEYVDFDRCFWGSNSD
ncbi:hypothetical protein [Sulfitobacter sp. PS-8MA]|uniref:hypothetical protein n=1 Tax=Sulfitobacter sp. PS-8MA TaxID=3237707 RepID=UPI0034C69DCD